MNGNEYDFEAAPTLEIIDPDAYANEFQTWRNTWTELEMPLDVYNADDQIQRDWVEAHV